MKQSLALRGIEVSQADFPYVELQQLLIKQLEGQLTNYKLNDIVPATVFRAEVEDE